MRCFPSLLVVVALLRCVCAQDTRDIFLLNITIFTDHEAGMLFGTNRPEVYLSCEDGRSNVDLDRVRDVGRPYEFNSGELNATELPVDGCVTCRLRESDATQLLEDDTFGEWTMCEDDFQETGLHAVEVEGEFFAIFECPECIDPNVFFTVPIQEPEPEPEVEPAPEPEEPPEDLTAEVTDVAPPPSPEPTDSSSGDGYTSDYYTEYYEGDTFSVRGETNDVRLQGEEEGDSEESGSSGGVSRVTVLSLCFVFLAVGLALGVALFWKLSHSVRSDRAHSTAEALELSKIGFTMKKVKC